MQFTDACQPGRAAQIVGLRTGVSLTNDATPGQSRRAISIFNKHALNY